MKTVQPHLTALVLSAGALLWVTPAMAQMPGVMQNVTGGTSSMSNMLGGSGMGSGIGLPSLNAAPPTNIAGLLQYCVKNNYLGGNAADATSVQQSLLDKATGSASAPANDSAYTAGSNGVLDAGNGKTMSLSGSGMQSAMTDKLCGEVLDHAKSLL